MSEEEIIRYVTAFADRSHGEQVRKYTGERYLVHPVRVMKTLQEFTNDKTVLCAALLHDVLEDTPVTAEEIREALLQVMNQEQVEKVIHLVLELTDVFIKNSYPKLNRRSRKEKEATRLSSVTPDTQSIKYADIIDNVTDIIKQDADFAKVYVQEAKRMLQLMDKGNATLRNRAMQLVDEYLHSLKPATLY
jgi:(p)ppGpp synthase/HD superfamily hydrolase